jgi:undecaprenyl-phosphate 4-deoxy-4-formamido-L-arabinose transferase
VRHDPRLLGESQYTFRHLVTHAFNMMTGFSTAPLQLASIVGFSFTLVGLLFLVYIVGRYLVQGGAPPGFPFLASQIAIFAGAQLFALGILGEYLARVHFRTLDKPSYVVRAAVSGAEDTSPEAGARYP